MFCSPIFLTRSGALGDERSGGSDPVDNALNEKVFDTKSIRKGRSKWSHGNVYKTPWTFALSCALRSNWLYTAQS